MKHKLKIHVSKAVDPDSVVSVKQTSLSKKLLKKVCGNTTKVTIIVPGNSVERVAIYEIPEEEKK